MGTQYALRSIDVWDTLLRRTCHPDAIKLVAARHLLLAHHDAIRAEYRSPWKLMGARCLIEGELAASARQDGRDDEYTLEQVLGELLRRTLTQPGGDTGPLVAELVATEVELEKNHTYADPECRAFLAAYPAEKTIFLSDFYMSAERLRELLHHHGWQDLFEDGVSSCDIGLNKRSGRLFRHVHRRYGVSPADHLHIGDSLHADISAPQALGVQTAHYLPATEHARRQLKERHFSDRGALFRSLEEQVLAEGEAHASTLPAKAASGFRLGCRAAPLLVGFCLFIAERSLIEKNERLFFLTREGEFFSRIFATLFPSGQLAGLALPQAGLLEVSRLATFCASLQATSTEEMMRMWNLYSTQSMSALLKSLGIAPESASELCAKHGLPLDTPVVYPWNDPRVQGLFADTAFQRLVGDKTAADRSLLLAYLAQRGLAPAVRRLGIVDIGWRGTIQDNLAWVLPDRELRGYYLGLARYLNHQPPNCRKSAFGTDLNLELAFPHLLDAVAPLEMLCNSPLGSVEGYQREEDGRVIARRHVDNQENAVHHEFVRHFQDGVVHAARIWAPHVQTITADELTEPSRRIWDSLITQSPQELADAYTALSHNEVFGVGGFVDKREVPSLGALLRSPFIGKDRERVLLYLKQTQWAAGLRKREDLGILHKALLLLALNAGQRYKHL
ncbi:MAG: hydrolase, partial [Lentisphaeria bacterium]|nr:hydrolase [Lentisphaeria bacterium]